MKLSYRRLPKESEYDTSRVDVVGMVVKPSDDAWMVHENFCSELNELNHEEERSN